MANVFISYTRESKSIAETLVNDIQELGHNVWFDQKLCGGQVWWDKILESLRNCDVLVFVMSPAALDSIACSREYNYAANLRKPVLPVLVSGEVSVNLLPPALSQIQFIDYRTQDHSAALRLARALNSLTPPRPLPDPLPEPPEVPLSYLGSIVEKINSTSYLNLESQSVILLELKQAIRDPESSHDAIELLKKFRKRRDLLATIAEEIEGLLRRIGGSENYLLDPDKKFSHHNTILKNEGQNIKIEPEGSKVQESKKEKINQIKSLLNTKLSIRDRLIGAGLCGLIWLFTYIFFFGFFYFFIAEFGLSYLLYIPRNLILALFAGFITGKNIKEIFYMLIGAISLLLVIQIMTGFSLDGFMSSVLNNSAILFFLIAIIIFIGRKIGQFIQSKMK